MLALVAFVAALPTVRLGYFLDDFFHIYTLDGGKVPGGPSASWDLYRFASGPPTIQASKDVGFFPWWTSDDFKIGFFRPIPSLWRAADHALFGTSPVMPHITTCVVYALLVFVVSHLLRRFLGDGPRAHAAAMLGTFAYAIDDSHGTNLAWTSNRYSILAALLGALAVVVFTSKRRGVRLLSAPIWGLALLSGEVALSYIAFFAAWAWRETGADRRSTLVRLAPHALLTVAWAIGYKLGGYGTKGSAFYVDPASTPLAYLSKAFLRAPVLAAAQLTFVPAEVTGPFGSSALWVFAVLALVVAVVTIRWIDRTCEGDRSVRALLGAGVLALVPVTATAPDDRLLLVPGIGLLGALSVAISRRLEARREGGRRGAAATFFFASHFIIAPLLLIPRQGFAHDLLQPFISKHGRELPSDPDVEGRHLFVVAAPDPLLASYMFLERVSAGGPLPRAAHVMSVGSPGELTVTRTGDRQLVFASPGGLVGGPFSQLYRDTPLIPGTRASIEPFHARVVNAEDGVPTEIVFDFTAPLSESRWVVFGENGFVEITPPPDGESLRFDGWDFQRAIQ